MSDTPNIVNITIPLGRIEVIDNNKVSSQVIIVDLPDNNIIIDEGDTTTVSTVFSDTATVAIETIRTNTVKVIEPGPQGKLGPTGSIGSQGEVGPRGYRGQDGSTFIITAITSSQYISALAPDSLLTGSLYILTNTNDEGNGISGSIGDGVIWSGTEWFNSGRIQGIDGPTGPQGYSVNGASYNSTNGMLTLGLSNGTYLPSVGSIKGDPGTTPVKGVDYDNGVGISDIYLDGTQLFVQLTSDTPVQNLGDVEGPEGPAGGTGPAGTVTVHSTVALSHLQSPTVTEMGSDSSNAELKFSIPGGVPGQSAHEVWEGQGNVGNEAAFLASLKGDQGDQGGQGDPGDGDIIGSGLLYADITASLWLDYQTNYSVGYVENGTTFAAGSTIESVLRAMLSQSQPPIPAALDFDGFYSESIEISYYRNEIGTDVEIDNVVFTKTGEGVTIGGISSAGADVDFGVPTLIDVSDTSPAYFTPQTFTRSTIGGVTMGLTWSGGSPKNKTAAFKAYAYLGGYPEIVLTGNSVIDNAAIQAMVSNISSQRSTLTSAVNWTVYGTTETQTLGNFTYIVYPSEIPGIANIIDGNGFSLQIPNPTWTLLAENIPIQNSASTADFTYNVDVYISEQERQITTLDQLNIT